MEKHKELKKIEDNDDLKKRKVRCVEPDIYQLMSDVYKFIGVFTEFKERYSKDKSKNETQFNEALEIMSSNIEGLKKDFDDYKLSKDSKMSLKNKAIFICTLLLFFIKFVLIVLDTGFMRDLLGINAMTGLNVISNILKFLETFINFLDTIT